VKQVGIAWAVMAMTLLLFVCRPRRTGASIGAVILACAVPFLVFGSWLIFSAANGLNGVHWNHASAQIGEMLFGSWVTPEGFASLPGALMQVLCLPARSLSLETGHLIELPKLLWMILLAVAPLGLIPAMKQEKGTLRALSLWTVCCFAAFLAGYVFSFMTAFYGEAAGFQNWSFSYDLTERYFCPCLISLWMLFAYALSNPFPLDGGEGVGRTSRRVLCGAMLAAILLCNDWQSVYQNLSWGQVSSEAYSDSDDLYTYLAENFWVDDLEEPAEAIVLYGIESYPFKLEWIQYAIAPVKLVLTPERELSREAFIAMLSDNHITHIVCMDENNPIYQNALGFAEDEWVDILTTYRVQWEGETPVIAAY
jgi:hypothetical protein